MTIPNPTELPASFPPEREVLSWEEFGDASRELASAVVDSGFDTDIVVAVARGGLLLAGAIAYALGTKNCGSINVEFYTDIDERLPEPVLHPPLLDARRSPARMCCSSTTSPTPAARSPWSSTCCVNTGRSSAH